ncbi:MAG: hypothetical protein WC329_06260 [Candidatus Omnitrophota bacterium]|jgi:hypothetical protein
MEFLEDHRIFYNARLEVIESGDEEKLSDPTVRLVQEHKKLVDGIKKARAETFGCCHVAIDRERGKIEVDDIPGLAALAASISSMEARKEHLERIINEISFLGTKLLSDLEEEAMEWRKDSFSASDGEAFRAGAKANKMLSDAKLSLKKVGIE